MNNLNTSRDIDLAAWWRPAMMITIMAVLFVNYALLPMLTVVWPNVHPIIFPDKFWELIAVIVGLYVTGRSIEKVSREYTTRFIAATREPDEGTPPKEDPEKPKSPLQHRRHQNC